MVMGILCILAAVLFPVLTRAKGRTRESACAANLGQIGTAIGLYLADNDGLFPAALDPSDKFVPQIWAGQPLYHARIESMPLLSDVLLPYAKSGEIFHCPADSGTETLDNQFPLPFRTAPSLYSAYGSSYFLRTEIVFRSFTDTLFDRPANINLMMDGAGQWHGTGRAVEAHDDPAVYAGLVNSYRYNVLYGDFHVKSVKRSELQILWATPL